MKKRVFALLVTLLMTLGLVACAGGNTPTGTSAQTTEPSAQTTAPPVRTTASSALTTAEPVETSAPETTPAADEERFEGIASNSTMVGTFTINSEWIPFLEPLKLDGWSGSSLAVAGDSFYVLTSEHLLEDGESEDVLMQYRLEDGKLTFVENLPVTEYSFVDTDDDGVLYASAFWGDFVAFKDGKQFFSFSRISTKCPVHPSGKWGLSWHSSADSITKFTIEGGILEQEDWDFAEAQLNTISEICISQNYIFIAGRSLETENHTIFVYDLDGNLKVALSEDKAFGDDASLASINAVIETENGFLAVDGNYRSICFFTTEGQFIGKISVRDFFGTSYPWMTSAKLMSDGSIMIGMTQERDDESCDEFLVYRLTGF